MATLNTNKNDSKLKIRHHDTGSGLNVNIYNKNEIYEIKIIASDLSECECFQWMKYINMDYYRKAK